MLHKKTISYFTYKYHYVLFFRDPPNNPIGRHDIKEQVTYQVEKLILVKILLLKMYLYKVLFAYFSSLCGVGYSEFGSEHHSAVPAR